MMNELGKEEVQERRAERGAMKEEAETKQQQQQATVAAISPAQPPPPTAATSPMPTLVPPTTSPIHVQLGSSPAAGSASMERPAATRPLSGGGLPPSPPQAQPQQPPVFFSTTAPTMQPFTIPSFSPTQSTGAGSSSAMAGAHMGAPFSPPFMPQGQTPMTQGTQLHLQAPTMQPMSFSYPPMPRMPFMQQPAQPTQMGQPMAPFMQPQPMVAFAPPMARVPIQAMPVSALHAPSPGGGPSIAQMMHMLHDGQMHSIQQQAQLSQMQQQAQLGGGAPGAPVTMAHIVTQSNGMQAQLPMHFNGRTVSGIAEKDFGSMAMQLPPTSHPSTPSTASMTHYAAMLTPPHGAAAAPGAGVKLEHELKLSESASEGMQVRGHQMMTEHADSEVKTEMGASVGMAPPPLFGPSGMVTPAHSESVVLAAAAAASAARESPPLPHLPAESATPAEMRAALQQLQAQNRQLQRCYQHVKSRFHDVLELVDQSTSAGDIEPPDVLLQIHGILSEAAARDSMLQTIGVEVDHDPRTTVPSTPRRAAAPLAYGAGQAPAQQLAHIAGRPDPRGRQRGKMAGFDTAELTPSGAKRKREPSVGVAASPVTPGGAMDFEDAVLSLSHLANVPQSGAAAAAATPRASGAAAGGQDRKSLIHTTTRVRKDAVAHSYGTRPSNRSTKFILEPSPPPSESEEEEGAAAGAAPRVKPEPTSAEVAAEEDADATSDDYEFEEEGYEEDELMADEEYTTSTRAPRVRIRNRSKAARAAAAAAASTPSTSSPVSVSSITSGRKRSVVAAGHHAMTAISNSVNRYPLFTVFVKVAAMWTVGKSEARQMSREEQTSLVLVPVRFMVLNAERRRDPHHLSHDDVLVIAKDISVLIHKRKDTVAKCWGKGTRLMLHDGSIKAVEEIDETDVLMGDDSTPRRVQSGSVFRGHTAEDASDLSDTAPLMYRVTSSNEARSTWTCNGDHILVLQFNDPPSAVDVETRRDHVRTFCFRTFALAEDGEVVHKAFEFSTRAEAEQAHERAVAAWRPLVWECTVNQFLVCSDAVKASATMFQPDLVHFPAPSHTLLKRLSAAIETRPEQLPSSLLKLTAWALGVWLADGSAGAPRLDKIGVDPSRAELILRLDEWCAAVASASPDRAAVTGGGALRGKGRSVKLGLVFEKLLQSYGLSKEKHFPADLLRESTEVRIALLSGVVDSEGRQHADQHSASACKVSLKSRHLIDGMVHLARSLGVRTSAVVETKRTNEEMCAIDHTFCVTIDANRPSIGSNLSMTKSTAQPHHCDSFQVTKIGHGEYFGFTLDGDGRCLLDDFTVSHNSIYNFDETEKMRVHVCSRPREAGRGSGVVGGGASISGGGASTTGLSTQVLTVLSYRGVQRLLKHSRSSLAPHVRRWVDQQYDAILADRQLLREHRARSERMDHLKSLPVMQARAEETKLLRMEEEEEMDVHEGFEQLAPGEGVLSDDLSSEDGTSVKEETHEPMQAGEEAHPAGDEFESLPASALAAVAAAAAASESELLSAGTSELAAAASTLAPVPVSAPRSHRKKPTAARDRRSHQKGATSAQPAPKRAKVATPTAEESTAPHDAAAAGEGVALAAPDGDGASTATGASVEHQAEVAAAPAPDEAVSGGALRVSKRATKGKKKKEPEFLTGAEELIEAATAPSPPSIAEPQAGLHRLSATATMDIDPSVYQAEVVAASPPYDALLLAPHMFPAALAASGSQLQQATMVMPSIPLPLQPQLVPFAVHAQSDVLMPGAVGGSIPQTGSMSTAPLQAAPTSPLHFLASASSSAPAMSLAMEAKPQVGAEVSSGTAPVFVSQLSPSNAALEKAQQATIGGPAGDVTAAAAHSTHTSPLFEAAARRSSVDTAISELHSPTHAAEHAPHTAGPTPADAASRSILHVATAQSAPV